MSFDFDTVPERRDTDSQKWQKYAGKDILPMWVADMDFQSAPPILDALRKRVDHGIFGYARPTPSTVSAVVEALRKNYGWTIDSQWLVWLPGLVCGLNVTTQAFAERGDEVLGCSPVYPPFMTAPKHSDRASVMVPLILNSAEKKWEIDFDGLEAAITPKTKLFLLCNPHNPVGRVFRRAELLKIGEFCVRHNLILCSDEIHCDLILEAIPHLPMATLGAEIAARTITLMAPSKTYNVPGLGTSFAVISDPRLRATFVRATAGIVAEVTTLGFVACEAAYRDGEPWRQALLGYLRGNRDLILNFAQENLLGVRSEAPHEATYLAWLNVADLRLEDPIAHFEKFGVGLSDGFYFGEPRGRHVRLNFGCPRSTLQEALNRMKVAVDAVRH